jgi:hypothetical protein
MAPITALTPHELNALRPSPPRHTPMAIGGTAALIVVAASVVLVGLDQLRTSLPATAL